MTEFNIKPFFLPGKAGKLFSIYYSPATISSSTKVFLHIPAFAEEMNKSRRMVSLQARKLAEQGHAVMLLDLFGTGDSEGDFSEATWSLWKKDIDNACLWLAQQGFQSVNLWGLRSGVLLAIDFLRDTKSKVDKLICWQPVLNGETFIMQFLRLRIAAGIMNSSAPTEKTSDLKQQLLEGKSIEVAGYQLNPDLVLPLMNLKASEMSLDHPLKWYIYEIVKNSQTTLSPVNTKFIEHLKKMGSQLEVKAIIGNPFWSTLEITEAPVLLSITSDYTS
jgi:exosortase A-associated hydrolase 2